MGGTCTYSKSNEDHPHPLPRTSCEISAHGVQRLCLNDSAALNCVSKLLVHLMATYSLTHPGSYNCYFLMLHSLDPGRVA